MSVGAAPPAPSAKPPQPRPHPAAPAHWNVFNLMRCSASTGIWPQKLFSLIQQLFHIKQAWNSAVPLSHIGNFHRQHRGTSDQGISATYKNQTKNLVPPVRQRCHARWQQHPGASEHQRTVMRTQDEGFQGAAPTRPHGADGQP